jgi:hypothetical protein
VIQFPLLEPRRSLFEALQDPWTTMLADDRLIFSGSSLEAYLFFHPDETDARGKASDSQATGHVFPYSRGFFEISIKLAHSQ